MTNQWAAATHEPQKGRPAAPSDGVAFPPNRPSLEDLERDVRAAVDSFGNLNDQMQRDLYQKDQRIRKEYKPKLVAAKLHVGQLLIAAKEQVEPGKWSAWLRKVADDRTYHRHRSTLFECMQIAGAVDPEKERARHKAMATARKQKQRERERNTASSVTARVTDKPAPYVPTQPDGPEPDIFGAQPAPDHSRENTKLRGERALNYIKDVIVEHLTEAERAALLNWFEEFMTLAGSATTEPAGPKDAPPPTEPK
jgi:hypothetical protein